MSFLIRLYFGGLLSIGEIDIDAELALLIVDRMLNIILCLIIKLILIK